jgi:hypothetical protein
MADARAAWNETGDKLTDLGRKLKVHYESQHGSDGQQTREELTDAARRLGSAVQDAFEVIGVAARDKAVQDDVKQVGQSLAEALGATLGQATEELRRAFSERKGPASGRKGPATRDETTPPGSTKDDAEPLVGEPSEPGAAGPGDEQPPKVEPWGTP